MSQTERLGFKLLRRDKEILRRLATAKGEAMSVVVRRLIRKEARRYGLWPIHEGQEIKAERISKGQGQK